MASECGFSLQELQFPLSGKEPGLAVFKTVPFLKPQGFWGTTGLMSPFYGQKVETAIVRDMERC